MEIRFLGGADEIGRSAIFVDETLLVDFGMKTATPPQFPLSAEPDAVVVSHGHLDHVGTIPALLSGDRRPPIYWTPPTRDLALRLARDTLKLHGGTYDCPFTEQERKRVTQVSETRGYREPFEAAGYEVTVFDAGHIPGSAHVLIDDGETRLLYTGDFHTDSQRLVAGSTARPPADVVLTESTYADVTHEDRDVVEARFAESVKTTLWEGGTVVIPAFAIGRTQELLLICAAHDIPCYVDGMGTEVTALLRRHPDFLRDPTALQRAKSHARFVTDPDRASGGLLPRAGGGGASPAHRERIAEQNTAIITTSGMLSGGPAMTYVPAIRDRPVNKITLTGYQVAGTPGRELLDTGRAEIDGQVMPIAAQVEQYDFSAHADRQGLWAFLEHYRDDRILVTHGDRCGPFTGELREAGFDASAPQRGDTFEC